MIQPEVFAIQSPCQRKCQTNQHGVCKTCYRTREERQDWLTFSEAEKKTVLTNCKQRRRNAEYLYKKAVIEARKAQRPARTDVPVQEALLDETGRILHPQTQTSIFDRLQPAKPINAKKPVKKPQQPDLPFK